MMKRHIFILSLLALLSGLSATASEELTISNGNVMLKQDLERGGAISYISVDGTNRNLVNIYDEGRYIQQSYYAGSKINRVEDGQSPAWSPWNWNPIQGGNYARRGARILTHETTDSTIYISCVPMLWDMNGHEADAKMEQWTEISGNVIKVRNRIHINSIDSIYHPWNKRDQEIPAVYPISALNNLHAYLGDRPWTGDSISNIEVVELKEDLKDSFWGKYPSVPEKWMAFTDETGWGLGVYSPKAVRFLAGRYTSDTTGEAHSLSTSYIAPLCTAKLRPKMVMEYDYYLILGNINQIRKEIYKINRQLNNNKK